MVNLMLSGLSSKLLAEFCGDSERTLQTWLKKVDEIGWEALVAVKQAGRPNKLNDEQINEIKAALKTDPAESGYNVWDGPALSDYIKTKYGIDYGVRACQILMHKMGFSLIRPQTYPSLGNPDNETREAFKKN
jgi:transposase